MLESLFGSASAEKVLLYLENYGQGYARGIADAMELAPSQVSKQLEKFEDGGILISSEAGRTRIFTWNPRNPLVKPLQELLRQALDAMPEQEAERYYRRRTRPRKAGKPL